MTSHQPTIVWFRDDLRMSDHPALHAAAKAGAGIIGLYVFDEASRGLRLPGGATRWWLAQSLRVLAASLAEAGGQLVLRKGAAATVVAEVAREAGVELGKTYPQPIIDHKAGRGRALKAYATTRND